MEREKKKFYAVKEFNTWSQGLGWEEFKKEYDKNSIKCYEEYIADKLFVTPTPWVKRLANMGDKQAAAEMFRREEMRGKPAENEIIERNGQLLIVGKRKKAEILQWDDEKTKISYNL